MIKKIMRRVSLRLVIECLVYMYRTIDQSKPSLLYIVRLFLRLNEKQILILIKLLAYFLYVHCTGTMCLCGEKKLTRGNMKPSYENVN